MRRPLTALLAICALSSAAYADCRDEVSEALKRQREMSGFRMDSKMVTEDGLVDMQVDYVLPNRMRQVVTSVKDPTPIETVVVSPFAWTRRQGEPWIPLNPQLTSELITQMDETVGKDAGGELGEFECLGRKPVDGEQMLAYQGENEGPGPKNLGEKKPKLPNRPVRVIYVDATTGLPKRSIFARADQLDKPIFQANYSYPADLKIEAPKLEPKPDAKPKDAGQ